MNIHFINNYFIKEKYKIFEDNSLNYDLLPVKFRTKIFWKIIIDILSLN